eukprot:m.185959 g.185959  ORF g.185959 m.185959 type:complete len:61 (-) comp16610_c0_seq1:362-544(-)
MCSEFFCNTVMRNRWFAHFMHGHVSTFCCMTTNWFFNHATRSHGAITNCFVFTSEVFTFL